jgi:VWFA-related protein
MRPAHDLVIVFVARTLAVIGLAGVMVAFGSTAEAQGGAPREGGGSPFFDTVDVDVVNVEVFVTDRKGNAVTGLTRDDFILTVEGKPVPVSNFYAEVLGNPVVEGSAVPMIPVEERTFEPTPLEQRLHLFVFVDNANIRPVNRKRVFRSLREFLDNSLSPDDLVTIASSRDSVFTHSDFMNDQRTLNRILDEIQDASGQSQLLELERRQIYSELSREELTTPARGEDAVELRTIDLGYNVSTILSRIRAYATDGYAQSRRSLAVLAAYIDTLAGVPGRKAMIHVSDGIPNKPGEDLYLAWQSRFNGGPSDGQYFQDVGQYDLFPQILELSRKANAARVTFYALDAEANHSGFVRSAVTEGITPQTNVSLRSSSAIDSNYREPLEMAAIDTGGKRIYNSPTLGKQLTSISTDFNTFYSLGFQAQGDRKPGNHDIEVKLVKDKRKGLQVRHRSSYQRRGWEERLASSTVAALLYNAVANPLEASLQTGEKTQREDGMTVLPVEVSLPINKLTLLPDQGVHAAQLSFFVTVKDKLGNARPVQKLPFSLRIPDEFVEQAKGDAARQVLPVVLSPGDQQVAIAIHDDIGAVSSTLRIELPASSS